MKDFKVDSKVRWNGRKDSDFLTFFKIKEEFLKSKKVHTISKIDNEGITCKLEGSRSVYDLTWLELVERPKAKLHIVSTPSSHVESRIEQSFFPKKGIEFTKHDLVNCVCWINRNKVEKEVKKMKSENKKQLKLEVLEEYKEWLEYQLEEVLNGTEWVSSKDNRKYKINSNTLTDVALMMANGYGLVLELKKELTRVKLAIINLE